MGLPVIGHGLEGASAASIPKGGNSRSKMAHKTYATPVVVASVNALTFQVSVMTRLPKPGFPNEPLYTLTYGVRGSISMIAALRGYVETAPR